MDGGVPKAVFIVEFVWIGANSIILPGYHLQKEFTTEALCKLIKIPLYNYGMH